MTITRIDNDINNVISIGILILVTWYTYNNNDKHNDNVINIGDTKNNVI
jgi:hypothetical protein